ncbi:hypothetical protein TrLO_g3671 [Triparma laevis f. longispina]|nr:hypothetical protein TrLO_g3671 [Triparma laevis f. longispina]
MFQISPISRLNANSATTSLPSIEALTFTLTAPINSLGCTVEETVNDEELGMVFLSCFPPDDCFSRARDAGLKVGDVITAVSSMFGSETQDVSGLGLKKVKELVGSRLGTGEELTIQVIRGTGVIKRHNAALDVKIAERIAEEDREKEMDLFGTLYAEQNEEVERGEGGDAEATADCIVDYDEDGLIDTLWINCAEDDGETVERRVTKDSEVKDEDGVGVIEEVEEELDPAEEYEMWRSGSMAEKKDGGYVSEDGAPKKKYSPSDYTNKSGSGTFIRNPDTGELERF